MKKGWIWIIIFLVVLGVLGFFSLKDENSEKCETDDDCAPAFGCHPTECALKISLPENPENLICTAVCSGPLDCGAGYCGCVKKKCEIIPNE